MGDTITELGNRGVSPQRAEIVAENGNKVLEERARSRASAAPRHDVFVALAEFDSQNPGFNIPLTAGTTLTFNEVGDLTDPRLHNPALNCVLPPCFDNVSLVLNDSHGNILAYVLQRFPGAVANVPNANFGDTYREIFLDPNAGSYKRNVFADFLTIPAFIPTGAKITYIEFRVDQHGTARLDDLVIGSRAPAGTEPIFRFFSPVFDCNFFTADEAEALQARQRLPRCLAVRKRRFLRAPQRERGGGLAGLPFLVARPAIALLYDRGTREEQADRPVPERRVFEGIAFFAFTADVRPAETVPLFRFLNNQTGCHLFTTSESERDN